MLQMSPALVHNGGALFDTDELPTDAAENARLYHSINAYVPMDIYHRRGAPAAHAWLRVQGSLACRYPSLAMDAWRTAKPGKTEQIGSLAGLLTVQSARAYCAGHAGTEIRATMRGYYVARTGVYVTGTLYQKKPISGGKGQTGFRVALSLKYRSSTGIPDRSRVTLRGLLDCLPHHQLLEVYSWQP